MTSVTFETATIADAIRRAARIAPSKSGIAFDQAAGLYFEITPSTDPDTVNCLIRATDTSVFHTEAVAIVKAEGDEAVWRLPSRVLSGVVASLPPRSGSQVTFTQEGRKVVIRQGRMKSTINLIDETNYPDWDMFDRSALGTVSGLGQRINRVEWAAAKDGTPPLAGVYIDGEHIYATDRYKLARIPCAIPVESPIVVPSGILGQCLKAMGDTGVGTSETQLLLSPDDWTQIMTVIYDTKYPPVKMLFDNEVYENVVEISKSEILEKISRASTYEGSDRDPILKTYWGKGEMAIMMVDAEVGLFGDVIELPGQLNHPRIEICFSPKFLTDALNNASDGRVKLHYHSSNPDPKVHKNIKVDDGSGYECLVMKRQESRPTT